MAFALFRRQKKSSTVERTPAQVAKFLEDFLNGTGPKGEWDDFLATAIADHELDKSANTARSSTSNSRPIRPAPSATNRAWR